ncbi:GNAT family N-acetyltransferase [Sedimenticola hydrogenitrophicus]|uniref:GNAT family N-acetyltransferase n=1 Tax=Sedimenticola hydrogenitrophicus TaxID=2967975 RepID=UPI0023B1BE94|nr:GNAT family N-acetyltransferase [Sedimenticola hydrogenitrophicus]
MSSDITQFKLTAFDSADIPEIARKWKDNDRVLRFEQAYIWYQVLLKYIKSKNDIGMVAVLLNDVNDLALVLPVIFRKKFLFNQIVPIANYYTSLFEILELDDSPSGPTSYRTLLSNLLANRAWDQMTLGPMDKGGKSFSRIIEACEQLGIPYTTYYWFDNYTLDLSSVDYENYYNQLPSRLRNTIKRKSRKLEASFDGYDFKMINGRENIDEAIRNFETVYDRSWKKKEGNPEFIREFSTRAAEEGWLRLGILRLNGQLAAAQLWYVKDGIASIFKLAHCEEFRQYSVGTLLFHEIIKNLLLHEGITTIDFLIGDDNYKKDWGFKKRERWGIMLINSKSIAGKLLYLRHIALPRIIHFSRQI